MSDTSHNTIELPGILRGLKLERPANNFTLTFETGGFVHLSVENAMLAGLLCELLREVRELRERIPNDQ